MKAFTIAAIVTLFCSPLSAQSLDVEFQVQESNQAAECSGAMVEGLDPNGDEFLAVRTGPGTQYAKIDELHNGDMVRPCARHGKWWGIYYGEPRRKGWVRGN